MAPPKKKNVVTTAMLTVPQLALEIRRLEGVIGMPELSRFVSSPKTLDTTTPQGFSVTYEWPTGKVPKKKEDDPDMRLAGVQPGKTSPKGGGTRLSGVTIAIARDITGPLDIGFTYPKQNGVTDIAKTILHEHVHAAILEWRVNNVRSPASLMDMLPRALVVLNNFATKNPNLPRLAQFPWPQRQFGPPADAKAVDEWLASRLEQKAVSATEPTVHLAGRYVDSALANPAPSGSDARDLQIKMLADLYDALDHAGIV